ncbi:hypothetical protein V2O64_25285 (plasmid) [Verrucomicrobiaceae bacterium 227]
MREGEADAISEARSAEINVGGGADVQDFDKFKLITAEESFRRFGRVGI